MPSFFSCWENSLYICGETQHSSQKQFHSIHSHSHPNLQKPNLVLLYSTKFRHFLHTRPGGGGGGGLPKLFSHEIRQPRHGDNWNAYQQKADVQLIWRHFMRLCSLLPEPIRPI